MTHFRRNLSCPCPLFPELFDTCGRSCCHSCQQSKITSHRQISWLDNKGNHIILYHIVLYCIAMYRIISYRIVPYSIVSYCIIAHRFISYFCLVQALQNSEKQMGLNTSCQKSIHIAVCVSVHVSVCLCMSMGIQSIWGFFCMVRALFWIWIHVLEGWNSVYVNVEDPEKKFW